MEFTYRLKIEDGEGNFVEFEYGSMSEAEVAKRLIGDALLDAIGDNAVSVRGRKS